MKKYHNLRGNPQRCAIAGVLLGKTDAFPDWVRSRHPEWVQRILTRHPNS